AEAHRIGRPSLALAQALQFDLVLRQKDVIGEWVPIDEPGMSDVSRSFDGRRWKWLWGVRWSEVTEEGDKVILRHTTSKRLKDIEVDLTKAEMVLEELERMFGPDLTLPAAGPIVINEETGLPYAAQTYRDDWRMVANAVGIPRDVWNMDSRAGGITGGLESGMPTEAAQNQAGHSSRETTEGYRRHNHEYVTRVLQARAAHRQNKRRTA